MPKYYCDYCKSYLTHDTMSVRKSHLMGKNHIRYYCQYYETKAKETGIWDPSESSYEVSLKVLTRGAPGGRGKRDMSGEQNGYEYENFKLPPPPNLSNFPNPPPSVFRFTEEYQEAIASYIKNEEA